MGGHKVFVLNIQCMKGSLLEGVGHRTLAFLMVSFRERLHHQAKEGGLRSVVKILSETIRDKPINLNHEDEVIEKGFRRV